MDEVASSGEGYYRGLLSYCETERQKQIVFGIVESGSVCGFCRDSGENRSTVRGILRPIERRAKGGGYLKPHFIDPNYDAQLADGQLLKGVTSLHNADGTIKHYYLKSDADKQRQIEIYQEAIAALREPLTPAARIKKPAKKKQHIRNLLNLYTLTDYHIGCLSWAEETGADWDIKIAEDLAIRAFSYLIESSPDAEVGFFNQLGDYLHYDSQQSITPTNKHLLDADGRPTKMIRAALRVSRAIIEMMAKKYRKVVVLMAEGNHDPHSSAWLRETFSMFYEKTPHIEVITEVAPYYAYEWGTNMLAFHHGHMKKKDSLDEVFVASYREMYGRTKLMHIHCGHQHHRYMKEKNTGIVEMHPTLAAADAYSVRHGYNSGRAMQVISYHKEFTETSRNMVHAHMLY